MSRFHMHVAVGDLQRSIHFYSALFGAEPTVIKDDYVKWSLEDPRINFAISSRSRKTGLDHVGIQTESGAELAALQTRLEAADIAGAPQADAACCYARSDKYWSVDPEGIAWEAFHTLDSIPTFNEGQEKVRAGTAREAGLGQDPADKSCCITPEITASGCC
ncbi:MAG: VOC family protein [Gammaproteobacteria bacterium]|nr:MAG: VOC family protein [Gammaproteobacteria bacterium]